MSRPRSRILSAPRSARILAAAFAASAAVHAQVPAGYAGTPWHDSVQVVPGILQPERYDEGASGITWFDTGPHIGAYTARNSGVDLDPVHNGDPSLPGSAVKAVPGDIYWGWLENNEWLKMTVDVKQAGTYTIHALVGTAMLNTSFKVDALQGTDSVSSGAMVLPFSGSCPVECYHYWNYAKDVGQIQLKAGRQVIRLQIVKSGYNIEYVELQPKGTTGLRRDAKARVGANAMRKDVAMDSYDAAGRNDAAVRAPRRTPITARFAR
jgi:hypothetical protein